mmetsp:Transcript_23470/g.61280  ORF Transcript_23470/g.61280 Transcript_23470/m.61280 type:complete len:376 (+) Transcript_23470:123-1250(+)
MRATKFSLLLLTTARAKVAPLPTGAKRFLVVGQPRAGSTWLTKYSPLLARCPGVVTTGEALHPLTVERLAPQLLGNDASAPLPLPDYTAYVRGVFEKLEQGGWNESSQQYVSPVRGAGFKVLYPQLPKRGFGVDSQSALKGFLKYAAASRVTLVHLVRLSQLERFMSLESIRQGQIQYHDGDLPSSHSRSRPTPLYIDPSKAYAWATKQAEQNEHLQLFFDRYCEKFGGTCLTVTYERLSSKNAIWAFAELRLAIFGESVACAPGASPPEWVPCSERVSNWPEVARRFNGTLWLDLCLENTIPAWARLAAARHARARARVTRTKARQDVDDAALARAAAHLYDKGAFFDAAGQLTYVPPGPARRPKRAEKYKRVY